MSLGGVEEDIIICKITLSSKLSSSSSVSAKTVSTSSIFASFKIFSSSGSPHITIADESSPAICSALILLFSIIFVLKVNFEMILRNLIHSKSFSQFHTEIPKCPRTETTTGQIISWVFQNNLTKPNLP